MGTHLLVDLPKKAVTCHHVSAIEFSTRHLPYLVKSLIEHIVISFTERSIREPDGRIDALVDEILREIRDGHWQHVLEEQWLERNFDQFGRLLYMVELRRHYCLI